MTVVLADMNFLFPFYTFLCVLAGGRGRWFEIVVFVTYNVDNEIHRNPGNFLFPF